MNVNDYTTISQLLDAKRERDDLRSHLALANVLLELAKQQLEFLDSPLALDIRDFLGTAPERQDAAALERHMAELKAKHSLIPGIARGDVKEI